MQAITLDELLDKMASQADNDLLLINVLDPEDFRAKHIPGSINIPISENGHFTEEVEKIAGGKDRQIVLYCSGRECRASEEAAEKLEDAGFLNIYDFEEGMAVWEENAGQTARVA